jgi:glucose-1-phosphate thymidylyltransferase
VEHFGAMPGIIDARTTAARLHPVTQGVGQEPQPVCEQPMICYPLSTLMLAGMQDILVITTPQETPSSEGSSEMVLTSG